MIGAPVWIPVAIGAAAVAAAGVAIYYGYKQYKYGGLNPVRRFRYLQYGVEPGDAGNNKKIFQLEEMMLDHIAERGGGLEIVAKSSSGGKDITMKDVYELMDMDDGWFTNKNQERAAFNIWYSRRFKPIFLLWAKSLREIDPKMPLLEADEKLDNEKLTKLLNKAWTVSRELYTITAGPFDGKPAVTDYSDIEDAYNLALKHAGKSESEKSRDKWKKRALAASAFLAPGAGLLMNYVQNQMDEKSAQKEAAALTASKTESASGMGMTETKGQIKNTDGIEHFLSSPMARLGKVSALQAIRYRAYGLTDLDTDRVRAVMALENLVFRKVSMSSSGNPHLPMDAEQVYMAAAGLFGLTPNSPTDRVRWCGWFGNRFKPVALAYMKAVKGLSPNADPESPEKTLKPDQLMQVAQVMLSAKNPDGRPIWDWTASPWSAKEKLNSDSNAISGSMLALKLTADKKVMAEEKLAGQDAAVNKDKGMLAGMMQTMKNNWATANDWLGGEKGQRNWLGRRIDEAKELGSRALSAGQAVLDNTRDAANRVSQGDFRGAAAAGFAAFTAPGRHIIGGDAAPREPKVEGTAKEREALLVSEAIKAGITDPQELAMLLGQIAAETGQFKLVSENLKYRPEVAKKMWPKRFPTLDYAKQVLAAGPVAFADVIYGNRMGNTAPGDGYKYRGRGLMQLTGKANYLAFERATGIKVVDNPDLVATDPRIAALSAIHYWKTRVRGKANMQDLSDVTRKINGGLNGLEHRRSYVGGYLNKFRGMTTDQIMAEYMAGAKSATVASAAAAKAAGTAPPAPPVTTTTTANAGGGVAAAAKAGAVTASVGGVSASAGGSVPATTAVKTSPGATNQLQTGGGYAASMNPGAAQAPKASASTPGGGYAAAVSTAPNIDSTASLQASAAAAARDEAARQAAAEKQRQAQAQQQRQVEAQSQRLAASDSAASNRVTEILQKSLEAQIAVQKNTADTVTLLREIIKQNAGGRTETADAAAPTPETSSTPLRSRPVEDKTRPLPVSMRFNQ